MNTTYTSRNCVWTTARWTGLLTIALCVCACDQNNSVPNTAVPSQVAAKVDGDEISIHQVNDMLERSKSKAEDEAMAKRMRQQMLDKLVDQQLLVQKAIEEKLDRTPDIQMALNAARREVLAAAYLKQIPSNKIKADDVAIRKYYEDHPPLFSRRRIFVLQEITFVSSKVPPETQAAIKAIVESGKPLEETVRALRGRGVEFNQTEGQRASEQITIELLPALYSRQAGQGLFVSTIPATSLLFVKSFEEAPLSEAVSWPRIARFLENQAANQEIMSAMSALRAKAKIDYYGDFSPADRASQK